MSQFTVFRSLLPELHLSLLVNRSIASQSTKTGEEPLVIKTPQYVLTAEWLNVG